VRLIFEQGSAGRRGYRLPRPDVPESAPLPARFCRGTSPDLPSVSELDVVRHYTRLSRLNFSVDGNFYPLGSCTMKYNPKFTEKIASHPGFLTLHPLLPQLLGGGMLAQGSLEVLWRIQNLLAEITGIYQAFGYRPAAEESPDHIAVETGVVAYLKLKQIHAECSGAAEEAQRCAEAAEYFLSRRLSLLAFAAREALEKAGLPYLTLAARALCERTGPPSAGDWFTTPCQDAGGSEEFTCGADGTAAEPSIPLIEIENHYGTVRPD